MLDLLVNAPTEVMLGGRPYWVRALTLGQLGDAQRWIRDHTARPAEVVESVVRFHPPDERRRMRSDAAKDEAEWPPSIGTEAGNRVLLSSAGGLKCFLRLMLSSLSTDVLEALFGIVTEDDLLTLISIAFTGLRPEPVIVGTPYPTGGRSSGRSRGPDYGSLFQNLLAKPPHWTHVQIAGLTLPQIALLANDGKPPRPRRREFTSAAQADAYLQSCDMER